jgi:hypothetical protein
MIEKLDKANEKYIKKNSLKIKCCVYKIINEGMYGYKLICYKGKTLIQFNFYPSKTKFLPALQTNQQVNIWFSIKHRKLSETKIYNYFVINIIEPYISTPKKTIEETKNTLKAFNNEDFETND